MAEGTSVCWGRDRLASPALVVLMSGEERWHRKAMGASQAWPVVASQAGAAQPVETGGTGLLGTRDTLRPAEGELRLGILSWSLEAPQCCQSGSVQRDCDIRDKCGPAPLWPRTACDGAVAARFLSTPLDRCRNGDSEVELRGQQGNQLLGFESHMAFPLLAGLSCDHTPSARL